MPVHHRLSLLTGLEPAAAGFATSDAPSWYAPDLPLEPVHIELRATVDLDQHSLDAAVRTTVRSTRDGARSLVLDGMDFREVEVQGKGVSHRYDGKKLHLRWAQPVPRGEERQVIVRYKVHQPLTGLHFGGHSQATPHAGRWAGTDHETERARYWLACVDHPSVRPRVDLYLRTQQGLTIVAGGEHVGDEEHGDDSFTSHWKLDWPCPAYLLCFFMGELVSADGGQHDGKPVAFYAAQPYKPEDLLRTFGPTADMLAWSTDRLGRPLPWPKYFQFSAPGIGGAMENISLVSWDDAWMCDPRMHAELGWLVDLINVHEMAHTWFGDAVVCRDFAHSWLKESWATYIESCWIDDHWGRDAMEAWLFAELRTYLSEARDKYQRPISTRRFDSSWDMFDGHLYPGGAVRLHLLRRTIGDDAFWSATTDYLRRYEGQTVETDDFRKVMEEHSGRSLVRFFDQWFRSKGFPNLDVKVAHDADQARLTVTVTQAQIDADKGIGAFELDLVLAVETAAGEWQRATLHMDDQRGVLTMPLAQPPQQVLVDPDGDLPHDMKDFDPGDDMLVRSLSSCPKVRGRIRAVQAACKLGRRRLIESVGQCYRAEPEWIARRLYASMLGESKAPQAAKLLAELLLEEQDPRVLQPLATACGRHRDARVEAALVQWLADDSRPWSATQAALSALGSQRGEAHLDLLSSHLARESRWDRVRMGALAGLGNTRSAAAVDRIRPWLTADAATVQVRSAACAALAGAVAWADRGSRQRAQEALTDRLRDPQLKVRQAAARALGGLGEAAAAGEIEAALPGFAVQDVPGMRRIAAKLRKADSGGKDKQLEELRTELRKLRERLDGLEARVESEA